MTTAQALQPGMSFGFPRNLVHTQVNPSCTNNLVTLNFFTNVNINAVGIVADALAVPGSPFAAYEANALASLQAASNIIAYDATCLTRCNLGPQGGQQPA